MTPHMAKHPVLLRPSEVTVGPRLLSISNISSSQPRCYLLVLPPSYSGLDGREDLSYLYRKVCSPLPGGAGQGS